ncbi:hypothetical protein HanIR_Chr06g0261661 [Helianthus annuus]|nr:hypothetical protein HanIR_Chr06g0261661 [Helianthus annuus]
MLYKYGLSHKRSFKSISLTSISHDTGTSNHDTGTSKAIRYGGRPRPVAGRRRSKHRAAPIRRRPHRPFSDVLDEAFDVGPPIMTV